MACSALQAAGVDARLQDEYVVAANWLYSNAVGGVKVMVLAADLDAARAVLDQRAVEVPGEPDLMAADELEIAECPRCASSQVVQYITN